MYLKLLQKKVIQQTAKAAGILIGNKISDKTAGVSKTSQQNNSEKNEEEIPRERLIPSELRRKLLLI